MEFEFQIDTPVENLDAVPSSFQHMYQKTDDGFIVEEAHHGAAKAFNGLRANLTSARKNTNAKNEESATRRKAIQRLEDGFRTLGITEFQDEEGFNAALTTFMDDARKGKNTADVETQLNNLKTQMTEAHNKVLTAKDTEVQKLEAELRHLLVDSQFTQALVGEGATSLGIKALPKLVANNIQVVREDDGKRNVQVLDDYKNIMYTASGDALSIQEYAKSLKENEEYGAFFKSNVPDGANTSPVKKSEIPSHQRDLQNRSSIEKINAGLTKLQVGR